MAFTYIAPCCSTVSKFQRKMLYHWLFIAAQEIKTQYLVPKRVVFQPLLQYRSYGRNRLAEAPLEHILLSTVVP